MTDAPYDLGPEQRRIVLQTAIDVCRHRGWILKAAHVRTTHVHLVVEAEIAPERIMNSVKSYSSRALKRHKS
jgi:REP element-mobilizing transposase RayT